jgi:glycosyltransferase involved in cell wall biosynthesis
MTFVSTYIVPGHRAWSERTYGVDTRSRLGHAAWALAHRQGPAILNGAVPARRAYIDLFAAAARRPRGQLVLIAEPTWEPGSRRLDRLLGQRAEQPGLDAAPITRRPLQRALTSLIDGPGVHYAVLSRHETASLADVWALDPKRVHFVQFCATRAPHERAHGGGGVFAGGTSLRDYRALAEAAGSINAPVRIATHLRPPARSTARVAPLIAGDYEAAALAADIVVVPLIAATSRSAGQQTYLNAMLRGQPVVVTRAPGVEDYVTHDHTGLVVDNEPRALTGAINALLADPERRAHIGAAARAAVLERFQRDHYFDRLLSLASRLTGSFEV